MYNDLLIKLIEMVLTKRKSSEELNEILFNQIDCEKIYDSDDELITDVYFSLKHYVTGEERIEKEEWEYLKDCLDGIRDYNPKEKMCINTKYPVL